MNITNTIVQQQQEEKTDKKWTKKKVKKKIKGKEEIEKNGLSLQEFILGVFPSKFPR